MPLHFELVSPEKLLFSGNVDQVDVPGSEGDFGVLEGHAPLLATLRPGILTIHAAGKREQIVVLGGFAEVSDRGLTIIADYADASDKAEVAAELSRRMTELEAQVGKMQPGSELDRLIARLDNFKQVHGHLTGTAMH